MKTKNVFKKNPLFQRCPSCLKNGTLHQSHPRDWMETIINNLTFYKIYRCRQCGWRNYISTFNFTALSLRVFLYYLCIVALISYVILFVLSKIVR